jgi:hypothetical protein
MSVNFSNRILKALCRQSSKRERQGYESVLVDTCEWQQKVKFDSTQVEVPRWSTNFTKFRDDSAISAVLKRLERGEADNMQESSVTEKHERG